MKHQTQGLFYIVATPIGNLADISQRALDTLKTVDLIAAEDTRHSKQLLNYFGITTPLLSLHEHNEQQRIQQLLDRIQQGQSIALISDAGTPLISDPGYRLIATLHENKYQVVPIPGSCAVVAALSAAGFPADQFIFLGFLSAKHQQRLQQLKNLVNETRTVVCYEAPHRILDLLQDMQSVLGDKRSVVVARELTKQFETIRRGFLPELITWMIEDKNQQRGEFVVVVEGQQFEQENNISEEAINILSILLQELSVKQAVSLAAKITQEKRNLLYDYAINHSGESRKNES